MKVFSAILILTLSVSSHAGLFIEMAGQNGSKFYYQNNMGKTIHKQGETIINYKKGLMYQIDHTRKTVEKIDLKKMAGMMKGMVPKSEPTGKSKTIKGYKCKVFQASMPMMKMETCEVHYSKLGISKSTYNDLIKASKSVAPEVTGLFIKKEGLLPVETIVNGPTGREVSTLSKVEERSIPSSTFKLPKGYQIVQSQAGNTSPADMQKAMKQYQDMMKKLSPEQRKMMEKFKFGK